MCRRALRGSAGGLGGARGVGRRGHGPCPSSRHPSRMTPRRQCGPRDPHTGFVGAGLMYGVLETHAHQLRTCRTWTRGAGLAAIPGRCRTAGRKEGLSGCFRCVAILLLFRRGFLLFPRRLCCRCASALLCSLWPPTWHDVGTSLGPRGASGKREGEGVLGANFQYQCKAHYPVVSEQKKE